MISKYVYIVVAVAVIAAFASYSRWLVGVGYDKCITEQAKAEKQQLKDDAKYYNEVVRPQEKAREKAVNDLKTKLWRTARANKGCYTLTGPLPNDFVDQLRDTDNPGTLRAPN